MIDSIFRYIFKLSIVGILFMVFLFLATYWLFLHGGVQHLGLTKVVVVQHDQTGHMRGEGCEIKSLSPGLHFIDTNCEATVTNGR